MTDRMRRIGLIGLGRMGHGIAKNLLAAGHPLVFQDHSGNRDATDILAAGATSRPTPAAVASGAEVIIVCVTGTPEVEAVVLGEGDVLEGLSAGTLVVDCSTAIPESTVGIAAQVREAGGRFMDAAMTRTPKEAEEGRLNLLVGAEADDFTDARPVLDAFAEIVVHAGPVGAGHRMKLIHNYVSLGFSAVLAEAAAVADSAGLSREVLVEVLVKGGGGSVVLDRFMPYLANGDTTALNFSLANAHKDIGYFAAMARAAGHALPAGTASNIADLYRTVGEAGGTQRSVLEAIDILRGLKT